MFLLPIRGVQLPHQSVIAAMTTLKRPRQRRTLQRVYFYRTYIWISVEETPSKPTKKRIDGMGPPTLVKVVAASETKRSEGCLPLRHLRSVYADPSSKTSAPGACARLPLRTLRTQDVAYRVVEERHRSAPLCTPQHNSHIPTHIQPKRWSLAVLIKWIFPPAPKKRLPEPNGALHVEKPFRCESERARFFPPLLPWDLHRTQSTMPFSLKAAEASSKKWAFRAESPQKVHPLWPLKRPRGWVVSTPVCCPCRSAEPARLRQSRRWSSCAASANKRGQEAAAERAAAGDAHAFLDVISGLASCLVALFHGRCIGCWPLLRSFGLRVLVLDYWWRIGVFEISSIGRKKHLTPAPTGSLKYTR